MLTVRISLLSGLCALLVACANRPQTEYFEPVGAPTNAKSADPAVRSAAAIQYGPNARLSVRAPINANLASVQLVLVLSQGADVRFTGRRVIIEVGGAREEREMTWDESIVENNRPRTFTGAPPKEGLVSLGIFQGSMLLPQRFQAATEFKLTIPAIVGGQPTVLTFVRKKGS
jgi:hypothetical protein